MYKHNNKRPENTSGRLLLCLYILLRWLTLFLFQFHHHRRESSYKIYHNGYYQKKYIFKTEIHYTTNKVADIKNNIMNARQKQAFSHETPCVLQYWD